MAEASLSTAIGRTLRWGTVVAGVLLAAALALAFAEGGFPIPHAPTGAAEPSLGGLLTFLHVGSPGTVLALVGLSVLALLPPARIALAAIYFAKEHDWRFLAFSLVALGLLALGNVVGIYLSP